jgi:hypothetical protein
MPMDLRVLPMDEEEFFRLFGMHSTNRLRPLPVFSPIYIHSTSDDVFFYLARRMIATAQDTVVTDEARMWTTMMIMMLMNLFARSFFIQFA